MFGSMMSTSLSSESMGTRADGWGNGISCKDTTGCTDIDCAGVTETAATVVDASAWLFNTPDVPGCGESERRAGKVKINLQALYTIKWNILTNTTGSACS